MAEVFDLTKVYRYPASVRRLARQLKHAGYYPFLKALDVVEYWLDEGKTFSEIRNAYRIGGGKNGKR